MDKNKFRSALLILFLSAFTFNASATDVTLDIPSNISAGQMFDVNVMIDPGGENVAGAQLDIYFNKSGIIINSINEGDFFKDRGTNTIFNSGTIDNSIGKAVNIYGAILGNRYLTTPGTFINIKATSIRSVYTNDISLENVLVVDPKGVQVYPVPAPEPIDQTQVVSSGGVSGGGGGSGGASGENYTNIEFTEKYDKYIYKDVTTSYNFKKVNNPIVYVNITGKTNSVEITTLVELLYGTSTILKNPSPGIVFKNINIWAGTYGYATAKNIKHAEIVFKIPLSWMEENNIDPGSIVMMRYDKDWEPLPTSKIAIYNGEIFYEARTIGFSHFAITGKKADTQLVYETYRKNEGPIIIEPLKLEMNTMGISPDKVQESSDYNKFIMATVFIGIFFILSIFVYKYAVLKKIVRKNETSNSGK